MPTAAAICISPESLETACSHAANTSMTSSSEVLPHTPQLDGVPLVQVEYRTTFYLETPF